MPSPLKILLLLALAAALPRGVRAQFIDEFDGSTIEGWFHLTGDGEATMDFEPHDGFARIQVDATQDRHNVWWAIIKRDISTALDLAKLQDPAYELRVEARVRPSHAPRRVNFMLNTQRTTDFHEHLREYDLASTEEWRVISMTTRDFDAGPGDTVFVQLGVTDWGPGRYHLDVDYYRADIVRRDAGEPDKGEPLVYHPQVPDITTFTHHRAVAHDSLINSDFPDVNFNDWSMASAQPARPVLTLAGNQWAVLRWDLDSFHGQQAAGAGVLELTTHSIARGGKYQEHFGEDLGVEFGKIRVFEVLGGDPAWDQRTVTFHQLLQGQPAEEVFNGQMIIDLELTEAPGGQTFLTLPRPVMQRLLDGRTKGLMIRPLGALTPSIHASEDAAGRGPKLHFSTTP